MIKKKCEDCIYVLKDRDRLWCTIHKWSMYKDAAACEQHLRNSTDNRKLGEF